MNKSVNEWIYLTFRKFLWILHSTAPLKIYMEVADFWEGTYWPFILLFYCLNQEKIPWAGPHCLFVNLLTPLVYCKSCSEPREIVLAQIKDSSLVLNLTGAFALTVTAITRTERVCKPRISFASFFKLEEALPRSLIYFWKQNDLCPIEDRKLASSNHASIFVILSYGLRGRLQPQCHHLLHTWLLAFLIPFLILSTVPSSLASFEQFLFLLPEEGPDFVSGTSFHSGKTALLESGVYFLLVVYCCSLGWGGVPLLLKSSLSRLTLKDRSALLLLPHLYLSEDNQLLLLFIEDIRSCFIIFLPTPVSIIILGQYPKGIF